MAKSSVAIQPSRETGSSPHPRRRGPNHALRPTTGVIRIAFSIAPGYEDHEIVTPTLTAGMPAGYWAGGGKSNLPMLPMATSWATPMTIPARASRK